MRTAGRWVLGALAVVVLVGGTACTDDGDEPSARSSPSASTPAPAPPPPRPVAGQCHRLDLAQAQAPNDDTRPVRCTGRHTTRTFYVGELVTRRDGTSYPVGSEQVGQQLTRTCPREFAAFLGGDEEARRLSRFATVWFTPTPDQAEAGADWFRCDVVAFARDAELLPLPVRDRLRGILDDPAALATYGLCGAGEPGTDRFTRVACALPHRWVALSTLDLQGGPAYPGPARLRDEGDAACADEARKQAGGALDVTYVWEYPTSEQWRGGQRYGYCWAPSRRARPPHPGG